MCRITNSDKAAQAIAEFEKWNEKFWRFQGKTDDEIYEIIRKKDPESPEFKPDDIFSEIHANYSLAISEIQKLGLVKRLEPNKQEGFRKYVENKVSVQDKPFLKLADLMPEGTRFNENKYHRNEDIKKWILDNAAKGPMPPQKTILTELKKEGLLPDSYTHQGFSKLLRNLELHCWFKQREQRRTPDPIPRKKQGRPKKG